MTCVADLATFDADGHVRVVVESPRGSSVKLAWDPKLAAFVFQRALKTGAVYPYDWGFVAGTRAADGDPLDAMILADQTTWPGVVVPSRPIAVVRLTQRKTKSARAERNDRVILVPATDPHHASLVLTRSMRAELEEFFVSTGRLAHAEVRVDEWGGVRAGKAAILAASRTQTGTQRGGGRWRGR